METISYAGQQLARWRVGSSTFLAFPEKGARLMNWNLRLADGSVRDVLYWPEDADFNAFSQVRGGNPILFPFNARTFDQGDIHFWRGPDGIRRPMPMHGFARQGAFAIQDSDATGFIATLQPGEEAHAAYPYDYEFTVRYRFEPLGLICELSFENRDTRPLSWSAGHHFYFTVPWSEGLSCADYSIRIPARERVRQTADGLLVPGPKLRNAEPLSQPALVDTIHLGLKTNQITFGESSGGSDVRVSLGTNPVPPPDAAIVTWTESDTAPFYCVEPWMGPPNAPGHKRGLHWVHPGQKQTFSVAVDLV